MQRIVFFITLILFLTDLSAAERQKIVFFRPAKVGNVMKCRLSAVILNSSTTSFADVRRSDRVTLLSRSITAAGKLTILSVKKSGHASKVEFTIDSIVGKMDDKKFVPSWNGKVIVADLTVKPVCAFRIKGSDKKLLPAENKMLSMLFQPAPEENISDYIGTDKAVGVGDRWKAKVSPFIKLFKKQGLVMPEKHVKGTVFLKSRKKYEGVECWEIEEKLNVSTLPGFTFYFSLSMLLPVDHRYGNMKITRKAFEKIEKRPTGKHFMTSGIKKITMEMTDTLTAIMLPVNGESVSR